MASSLALAEKHAIPPWWLWVILPVAKPPTYASCLGAGGGGWAAEAALTPCLAATSACSLRCAALRLRAIVHAQRPPLGYLEGPFDPKSPAVQVVNCLVVPCRRGN